MLSHNCSTGLSSGAPHTGRIGLFAKHSLTKIFDSIRNIEVMIDELHVKQNILQSDIDIVGIHKKHPNPHYYQNQIWAYQYYLTISISP
jgi:hypothetical protein